jgi:hypothetical protein
MTDEVETQISEDVVEETSTPVESVVVPKREKKQMSEEALESLARARVKALEVRQQKHKERLLEKANKIQAPPQPSTPPQSPIVIKQKKRGKRPPPQIVIEASSTDEDEYESQTIVVKKKRAGRVKEAEKKKEEETPPPPPEDPDAVFDKLLARTFVRL